MKEPKQWRQTGNSKLPSTKLYLLLLTALKCNYCEKST